MKGFLKGTKLLALSLALHLQRANTQGIIDVLSKQDGIKLSTYLINQTITKVVPNIDDFGYTLFVPTDEAYKNYLLLQPSSEDLFASFLYQILGEPVFTNQLEDEETVFIDSMLVGQDYVNLNSTNKQQPQVVGLFRTGTGTPSDEFNMNIIDGTFQQKTTFPSIVKANINVGKHGVVHIVDKVFEVPKSLKTVLGSLITFTRYNGMFNRSGLLDVYDNKPGITVFATENEGQNWSIPPQAVEANIKSSVVSQNVIYTRLFDKTSSVSSDLDKYYFSLSHNKTSHEYRAGNALVTIPNILLKNGVLHGIDSTIYDKPPQTPTGSTKAPARRSRFSRRAVTEKQNREIYVRDSSAIPKLTFEEPLYVTLTKILEDLTPELSNKFS
ncbi:hypothetical protein AX774_g3466 [Zancudomyces culisetae]|uniref:FAS1 domain-containing protein n=1 Tax=Zancudomyces culisetae TaxID=1213189 RepID=A0A1R1PQ81_ZANCU|nr:hypothetical protein AX774_g3466 [Zancudomyces culisetae]|eukprot:OMH83032.1 hypothetical protein AX774_g3466 [Zancudomyces culisetae]